MAAAGAMRGRRRTAWLCAAFALIALAVLAHHALPEPMGPMPAAAGHHHAAAAGSAKAVPAAPHPACGTAHCAAPDVRGHTPAAPDPAPLPRSSAPADCAAALARAGGPDAPAPPPLDPSTLSVLRI